MKEALWAFIASLFLAVRWDSAIDRGGEWFSYRRENRVYGQQTTRKGKHRLHERAATDLVSHDVMSWIDLVHQLDARTRDLASGCPVVVVVQPTHDRKSDHLVACILSGRNRSARFGDLLPNALMGSCPVEVHHIGIEDTLELLLLKDQ